MPSIAKPSLPELQRWMRWVLTYPSGVGDVINLPAGKARIPKNWTRGSEPKRCLPVIGESTTVSQEERLSIYGAGYFLRIVGVMGQNYAALRAVLGEHDFDDHLAREYLVKYPSTYKCIDNIGNLMPQFLERHPFGRKLRFLPDLAGVEWAFHESFYADEWPMIDFVSLKNVPLQKWAKARITLDPSVRLLDLNYNVLPLWRADGRWTRRRLRSIKRKPTQVIVYRKPDLQVRVGEEPNGAVTLLKSFKAGKNFGAALQAAQKKGLTPAKAMRLFGEWAALGIIRRVDFR